MGGRYLGKAIYSNRMLGAMEVLSVPLEWQYKYGFRRFALVTIIVLLIVGIIGKTVDFGGSAQASFWERYEAAFSSNRSNRVLTSAEADELPSMLPPFINLGANSTKALGRDMNAQIFGDHHWQSLHNLWMSESGWNPRALNPSSGACGIPQALPCSKIPNMSTEGQIKWGLAYIERRYGNPTNAWDFWLANRWY